MSFIELPIIIIAYEILHILINGYIIKAKDKICIYSYKNRKYNEYFI